MSFLLENWSVLLVGLLTVLGGAVAILKVVAPRTNTEADNKILAFLSKVVEVMSGLVTPKLPPKP
jgi:hypothetical protein